MNNVKHESSTVRLHHIPGELKVISMRADALTKELDNVVTAIQGKAPPMPTQGVAAAVPVPLAAGIVSEFMDLSDSLELSISRLERLVAHLQTQLGVEPMAPAVPSAPKPL